MKKYGTGKILAEAEEAKQPVSQADLEALRKECSNEKPVDGNS